MTNPTEYLERKVKALEAENEMLHEAAVQATKYNLQAEKENLAYRQQLQILGLEVDKMRRHLQLDREIRAMKERLAWN